MSLYADEDLSTVQDLQQVPSTSSSNSTTPADPLAALSAALTCTPESQAQAEAFVAAGQRFEENPEKLPDLCGQLLPMVVDGGESLLRAWTLDMVALTVGRSGLHVNMKEEVAERSLDALTRLLTSNSVKTIRAVIPIFSTIYPVIFRLLATSRPSQDIYNNFMTARDRILAFVNNPNAQPDNVGIKAAAWKFAQKVLIAGTRGASADPRLQSKGQSMDPNINMITSNSPLNYSQLDEEANMLRTQLITQLYSASEPAVLHAIINILPGLCKARPSLAPLIASSMAQWTPAAMAAARKPLMQIRAVEKTLRVVMTHLVRHHALSAFSAQFKDALVKQKARMDEAFVIEQLERKGRREGRPVTNAAVKHAIEAESSETAAKRAKLEHVDDPRAAPAPRLMPTTGREIDISPLPEQMVIEHVIRGLQAVSADALLHILNSNRIALIENRPEAIPVLRHALVGDGTNAEGVKEEAKEEDDAFVNPLDMDVEDDEDLLQLAAPDEDEAEEVMFAEFKLPPPAPLDQTEKAGLADVAVRRIWTSAKDLATLPDLPASDAIRIAVQPKEIWMLLLSRLATRGADIDRQALCNYVAEDFASRSKFASVWLNEEWYNGKVGQSSQYTTHLDAIIAAFLPKIDAKDKALAAFLSSLPEISTNIISVLETLCLDVERSIVGFLALRDLIESRPPVRQQSLDILLQLCTHPDLKLRVMAISTVKRWVPGSPMSAQVIAYGLGVLKRLTTAPVAASTTDAAAEAETGGEDADVKMADVSTADGNGTEEEEVHSRFLTEVTPDTVRQHVELIFALSRRQQNLLDHIFRAYTQMTPELQDALESLLTPLIQSLGATAKLLDLLRHFPPGAEKLALKILYILSGAGSSLVLVNVVKGLMSERDLDPKFIIPIIGQLDKADIEKQIPKIVALLGEGDSRDLVRNAFASVLQKMTPAELMVTLHAEETSLKPTIEAIGICFSMTSVFRSDVLAAAMQRIADLPELPMIFMRTIIQAVTTYKSLGPFVANYVLPKLITKKIWTNPQLWDGFIRLARRIAPASFGALVQLPKEWLLDVVEKQPALKQGLKGFLTGRPGTKEVLNELFGEEAAPAN